ncbi:MAG: glutathione S-transferase family protein [Alphaproteobacteria bacterium]
MGGRDGPGSRRRYDHRDEEEISNFDRRGRELMYRLLGSPRTRAIRVLWMLEELGVDYEIEPIKPGSEAALAVNPSGKLPALDIGGEVIIDSVAICQYLADVHGKLTYPTGTIGRARQDSWTCFALDELDAILWSFAKHSFVLPEALQSATAREACRHEFEKAMAVFGKRLGTQTYVMGDDFTVPDIILGHCAGWAKNGPGWPIPEGPVLDYVNRVRSRPACLRALDIREQY